MKNQKNGAKKKAPPIEKVSNLIAESKKITNILFIVFLVVFVGGYFLFFTSKLYLPTNTDNFAITPLHESQSLNEKRFFTINRWDYSEQQRLMEIEIDIDNKDYENFSSYEFSVRFNPSGRGKVTTIIGEDSYLILHIENVPKDWQECSLRVALSDNSGFIKLYSNIEAVNKVESLSILSKLGYMIKRMNNNILIYEQEIQDLTAQKSEKQKTIEKINAKNAQLEADKIYLTPSEIQDINEEIKGNHNLINQYEDEIADIEQQILNTKNKIDIAKEHIKALQK